jgi:hypothetical protein
VVFLFHESEGSTMPDGAITFSTALDNKELDKQLSGLTKKITNIEDRISQKRAERAPLAGQSKQLAAQLDAAKAHLEYMQSGEKFFTSASFKDQQATIQATQKEFDGMQNRVERYDDAINRATIELDRNKERAGQVAKELAKSSGQSLNMGAAVERAGDSLRRFQRRLREVVRSALIFTLISQSLAKMREWMGKVVTSNDEASKAVARLKAALLTLVQPLVGVVIPAFTAFVNVLARVVAALAQGLSMLFGTTVKQSAQAAAALYEQTDALDATGAAAKKTGKLVAAFDEINQLGDNSGSGGGAGNAAASPAFDFDTVGATTNFEKILNVVKLIGAAFLAWKLTGSMQELFSGRGLMKLVGAFITLDGAIGLAKNTIDAWQNGVNWENFSGMLGRGAELVLGLFLLLGKTGAAVGLVVSGLTLLATAFHDAANNGWTLQNKLMAIAGMLATGLGIGLLVGSWVPLLIGAIAAILLAITTTFGDGEKLIEDAKKVLRGFIDFFVGVFTGDLDKAMGGVAAIFEGLKGIAGNILGAIKNMLFSFLDWVNEKTHGALAIEVEFFKGLIGGLVGWMTTSFNNFADSFRQIFEGIILFISGVFAGDWDRAWSGIVTTFKGIINLLISMVESFINGFVAGINTVIEALNTINVKLPGGKSFGVNIPNVPQANIPRLATGAVIPPNREFMAVLGDQRSGTNIEAPMSTIEQGVENVLRRMGVSNGTEGMTMVLEGNLSALAGVLHPYLEVEGRRVGVKLVGR